MDSVSKPEVRPHESLYFEDGDIVLMSLPKDDVITAFRVDKVFLSRHSPVFKDMFSFPSPDDVEQHDGVPLVRLQDEAAHLVSFLKALYDPSTIPYEKHRPDTVKEVEGTLKLCTKYQNDGLRQRIINHLSADWPNTLSAWDIFEKEMLVIANGVDESWPPRHVVDNLKALPDPCSVIRLARECDIPQLLPAAFYHLSRIPTSADPEIQANKAFLYQIQGGGCSARSTFLSRDDLMCLLQGSRAMAEFIQCLLPTTLHQAMLRCQSRERCEEPLRRYSNELEMDVFHNSDPLDMLGRSETWEGRSKTICFSCKCFFSRAMYSARSELWENLPKYFGFEAN